MIDGFRFVDLERRLHNLLMVGTVLDVDTASARCRVQVGKITTTGLPWLTQRAGSDRTWWAPEVGEQVLVLSPSGETAQGVVMPALYQSAYPAPGGGEALHIQEYADGTRTEYDRDTHKMTINCVGDITIEGATKVTINSGGTIDITAGGDVTLKTSSLTVDSEKSTFTGAVTIQGLLAYQGGMSGSGGPAGAAASISGSLEVSDDVTAGGVSLTRHTHTGDSGGDTSSPK